VTHPAARALLACAVLGLACASEPILYPNETLQANGETQADRDIEQCSELAKEFNASPSHGGEAAKATAEDAVVGGAAGAAGGAVFGNAGTGAAAGAAAGAAGGIVRSIFRWRRDPDPTYRRFVEICLQRKGYEVVGWE
jgi:hypothetical protein